MHKTISISISKTLFHVEEDGYELLAGYLSSVKGKFSAYPDGEEIVSDIESRIAERFLADREADRDRIVTKAEVESLIASMGQPEEFGGDAEPAPAPSGTRKLYRDPDDAIIAGVASGVGAYLGLQPVVVRLIFLALVLGHGFGLLLYVVLWVLMPEARTATEKLQMKGDRVTLESVDKVMKDAGNRLKRTPVRRMIQGPIDLLAYLFRNITPIVGAILGFLLSAAAVLGMFGLIFAAVIALVNTGSPYVDIPLLHIGATWLVPAVLGGFLIAFIPLLFILGLGRTLLGGWNARRNRWGFGLLGIWFLAIILVGASLTRIIPRYHEILATDPAYRNVERNYDLRDFDRVEARSGLQVELAKGEFRVAAEGRDRDLQGLRLVSQNGTLVVERMRTPEQGLCILCPHAAVRIKVSLPELASFTGENGLAVSAKDVTGPDLKIELRNGAHGSFELPTSTKTVKVDLENATWLDLRGAADMLTARLKNGSRLDASALTALDADVQAENASEVELTVHGSLTAVARNGAYVRYAGHPARVERSAGNASRIESE